MRLFEANLAGLGGVLGALNALPCTTRVAPFQVLDDKGELIGTIRSNGERYPAYHLEAGE